MQKMVILPRGGLGDVLYHTLFAAYIRDHISDCEPYVLAPAYGAFLTSLLGVKHVPAVSFFTDASSGLQLRKELSFLRALLTYRGGTLASFTNDVVDHGLARVCRLGLFDKRSLGNSLLVYDSCGLLSRYGLNKFLRYSRSGEINPQHIVARQQHALAVNGLHHPLPDTYRKLWQRAILPLVQPAKESRTVLLFPETAALEKNLTAPQVKRLVEMLRTDYDVRIFTRTPALYAELGVTLVGFEDRLEPLRQIVRAAAVITADTFAAHLSGVSGTRTYTIYNHAPRPKWCEYWGAPFANVLHYENGVGYSLTSALGAMILQEDSPFAEAAATVSKIKGHTNDSSQTGVMTGFTARAA